MADLGIDRIDQVLQYGHLWWHRIPEDTSHASALEYRIVSTSSLQGRENVVRADVSLLLVSSNFESRKQ